MSTVKLLESAESASLTLPFEIENDKLIVHSDSSTDEKFVNHTRLISSRDGSELNAHLSLSLVSVEAFTPTDLERIRSNQNDDISCFIVSLMNGGIHEDDILKSIFRTRSKKLGKLGLLFLNCQRLPNFKLVEPTSFVLICPQDALKFAFNVNYYLYSYGLLEELGQCFSLIRKGIKRHLDDGQASLETKKLMTEISKKNEDIENLEKKNFSLQAEKSKLVDYFKEAIIRMRPLIVKMYNKMLEDDSTKEYKFKGKYKQIFDLYTDDELFKRTFQEKKKAVTEKFLTFLENLIPFSTQMLVAVIDQMSSPVVFNAVFQK